MSSLKLRYLFIFLVFALLLGIWTARTQLLEFAITSSMRGYGLKNVTAEIHQLGLSQTQVSRFGFSLQTDTGLFSLEAYDLNMDYGLQQLADGRVENLAINKIVLHSVNTGELPDNTQTVHQALEPLIIIAALRRALREYIIFDTFSVEHMTLEGEPFGILQEKSFEFKGTNDAGTTYAELNLLEHNESGQEIKSRQLAINKLTQDSLSAELKFTASQQPAAAGLELDIRDRKINGAYHINAQPLKSWMRPFANTDGIIEAGKVNGTFSSSFESGTAIVSSLTAMFDKYVFREIVYFKRRTPLPIHSGIQQSTTVLTCRPTTSSMKVFPWKMPVSTWSATFQLLSTPGNTKAASA